MLVGEAFLEEVLNLLEEVFLVIARLLELLGQVEDFLDRNLPKLHHLNRLERLRQVYLVSLLQLPLVDLEQQPKDQLELQLSQQEQAYLEDQQPSQQISLGLKKTKTRNQREDYLVKIPHQQIPHLLVALASQLQEVLDSQLPLVSLNQMQGYSAHLNLPRQVD